MSEAATIAIRDALPGDAAALIPLLLELGYTLDERTVAERFPEVTAGGAGRVLVAIEDGRPVGLVTAARSATLHRGLVARITALVITEHARGRGVGRALVAAVEVWSRDAGCSRLEVTSAERRTDAHAFYRSLGFSETPKRFVLELVRR